MISTVDNPLLFIIQHSGINPLNSELNPICHLLALLGAHRIFQVSGLRVNIVEMDNFLFRLLKRNIIEIRQVFSKDEICWQMDSKIAGLEMHTNEDTLTVSSNVLYIKQPAGSKFTWNEQHFIEMRWARSHIDPSAYFMFKHTQPTSADTCMIWYGMIYDMWYVIWYIWYDICDIWYVIYDIWYTIWYMMICTIWYDMIYDILYDIWYDMIWHVWYMIWYDVIWYDIWYFDMIWYDMIWYDMIWYAMWYDMIWYICYDMIYDMMIWYAMWYDIYDTIRYDTIWYMIWYMIWYIWYI
jgi:hypothetical protein